MTDEVMCFREEPTIVTFLSQYKYLLYTQIKCSPHSSWEKLPLKRKTIVTGNLSKMEAQTMHRVWSAGTALGTRLGATNHKTYRAVHERRVHTMQRTGGSGLRPSSWFMEEGWPVLRDWLHTHLQAVSVLFTSESVSGTELW